MQNEPSGKSFYSTICDTKRAFLWLSVRTFILGHIFPLFFFPCLVLEVRYVCSACCRSLAFLSRTALGTANWPNPKSHAVAFFRPEAFRDKCNQGSSLKVCKMHPKKRSRFEPRCERDRRDNTGGSCRLEGFFTTGLFLIVVLLISAKCSSTANKKLCAFTNWQDNFSEPSANFNFCKILLKFRFLVGSIF